MARKTTTNAIGLRQQLFGVSNSSRVKIDTFTAGFAATPSYNRQESVLSPAVGSVPATVLTLDVRSVLFIRTSAKVKIRVTRADASFYEQIVTAIFSMSPSEEKVTVTIEASEAYNVNCIVVWS